MDKPLERLSRQQVINAITQVVSAHLARVPGAQFSARVDDIETTDHHPPQYSQDGAQWRHFGPGEKLVITLAPPETLLEDINNKVKDLQDALKGLVFSEGLHPDDLQEAEERDAANLREHDRISSPSAPVE